MLLARVSRTDIEHRTLLQTLSRKSDPEVAGRLAAVVAEFIGGPLSILVYALGSLHARVDDPTCNLENTADRVATWFVRALCLDESLELAHRVHTRSG